MWRTSLLGRFVAWCGTLGRPPTSPFCLYICFIWKTLNTQASIHEKFYSRSRRQTLIRRVLKLFPAPCRRGESSPEGSTLSCLPPE